MLRVPKLNVAIWIGLSVAICFNSGCDTTGETAAAIEKPGKSVPSASNDSIKTAFKIGYDSEHAQQDSAKDLSPARDLRKSVASVLDYHLRNRLLSGEVNAAWQIMHGVLAYGDRLPLSVVNVRRNTLEYLLDGGVVSGWELAPGDRITPVQRNGMTARLEPGSYIGQGHVDQWIAILAQLDQPLTRRVVARGKAFTIEDWVRQAQWDVPDNPVREYSWTIMAIARYFPKEASWVAKDGKTWTLEPLASFEAKQNLANSPCGGMHRLMGLAHAVQFYKNQNPNIPISGGWKEADDRVKDAIDRIRRFQNSDGTFSTNHTERPGTSPDLSVMISSTGHTIEFLSFALNENQLSEPWIVRGVDRLCQLLEIAKDEDLECGGLYHSLNGLKLYYEKRYQSKDWTDLPVTFTQ
jgi:hypothetical protein